MNDEINIEKLAKLSRIFVSPEEKETLKTDINSVLSYVEQIKDISAKVGPEESELINVMREDVDPHETGIHTKELLNEAPSVKDDYIEVKKIISQDN